MFECTPLYPQTLGIGTSGTVEIESTDCSELCEKINNTSDGGLSILKPVFCTNIKSQT